MFWYISSVLSSCCSYILLTLVTQFSNPHDWVLQLSTLESATVHPTCGNVSNTSRRVHPNTGLQVFMVVSQEQHRTLVFVLDVVALFFTNSENRVYSNSSLRWVEQDVLISCRSWPQPFHGISLNPDWVISTDSKILKVLPHEVFIKTEQKNMHKYA